MIAVRGKLGRPNGVGRIMFGWSKIGERNDATGIYRRDGRWRTQRTIRCRHYKATNPQTPAQQARRTKFANGVQAWHALPQHEKDSYNARGAKMQRTGFLVFMSQYLQS